MGCGGSKSVPVRPSSEKRALSSQKTPIIPFDFTITETSVSFADINYAYSSITKDVSAIKCPPNMVPVLCMAPEAVPLVVTSQDDSDIKIPIIAMSIKDEGRVICFAHIQMITLSLLEAEQTAKFFRNLMKYIVKNEAYMAPVLLLETNPRYDLDLRNLFSCIYVSIDKGTFKNKFDRYRIIVMTHDCQLTPENNAALHEFVNSGGTIMIFYDPKNIEEDEENLAELPINKFLISYSLSYTIASLIPRCTTLQTVPISPNYSDIHLCNFLQIASYFRELISNPEVSSETLDEAVTNLRYYIIACDESFSGGLKQLMTTAIEFLYDTNYRNGNEICHQVNQSIIAVIVQDIYEKLPLDMIESNPDVDIFPGDPSNIEMSDHSITLTISSDSLISTGLWCPPGCIVHVTSSRVVEGLSVQIGSHQTQLYTLPGPWHRWPSVVFAFPLNSETVEICSPFGGILYISTNDQFYPESPSQFYFTFSKVCRYPRVVKGNPSVFNLSKNIPLPWGEVESTCLILTLPSEIIVTSPQIIDVLNAIDQYILKLNVFMSYDMIRPYRVVFDVDIIDNDGEGCSYPIVMPVSDARKIVSSGKTVTDSLYRMIKEIAYASIRDQFFDKETEVALSALAAIAVLEGTNQTFNHKTTEGLELPFLFKEFWTIHKKNPKVFMEVLKQSQFQNCTMLDVNEDRWVKFVQDLCRVGKRNFIPIFQNVRPVPRSFTESTTSLPISEIAHLD
ncbi:hypothetical protein TRFO_39037 [Tritrichomonas foetus]|uniref:Peptidase M60 domain-containing protein n=1 Tax=Tritrichomonas foetus TaxID=1144522 RepID=A0A1J4J6C5_9EUKA|nr:hypothetical protein TRFO_39037 [Tritrichomonas foetus]|eukprot:OHS94782.1 hypothetical protein TRFO_39037 [Tritrichomonas foetus]